MKTLITGGLGFIGLHVAQVLAGAGRRLVLLDNLSPQIHGVLPAGDWAALLSNPNIELLRGDVRCSADWARALDGVDCVIHLAAETGTAQSMYEIRRYVRTNDLGTAALLHHLANRPHTVAKLILASSRAVYGEGMYDCKTCGTVCPATRREDRLQRACWEARCPTCDGPIDPKPTSEEAETKPGSIYAVTKLTQEHLVRVAGSALGIPYVIFRFQNVYGEGQSLKNPYTGILSIFSNQLRQAETVRLYEDGKETRDFVHVSDVARAVWLAADSPYGDGQVLNVGSGVATTVQRIAFVLSELFGSRSDIVVSGEYRLGDIRHGYADLTRSKRVLGFSPQTTLENGLDRFVSWVKRQPTARVRPAAAELLAHGLMGQYVESEKPSL